MVKHGTCQVFKLDVQVLADGELGVRDGFVEVRVQVMEHLWRKGGDRVTQRYIGVRRTSKLEGMNKVNGFPLTTLKFYKK